MALDAMGRKVLVRWAPRALTSMLPRAAISRLARANQCWIQAIGGLVGFKRIGEPTLTVQICAPVIKHIRIVRVECDCPSKMLLGLGGIA